MSLSFGNVFSRKNLKLVVGLISLLIVLWVVMFSIPSLFVNLFDTGLGNLILLSFVFLAAMYNTNLAVGLSIVFIVLYRFSRMSMNIERFII